MKEVKTDGFDIVIDIDIDIDNSNKQYIDEWIWNIKKKISIEDDWFVKSALYE